ncbi:hypothetical protein V5O48_017616 [Marasmius crinis-equi]|uniref:Uncharacterized protein n=1 Tax=Marasmius crinis-equi TaxID=585013 RepID=A0ABR3ENM7_9AGAR
MHTVKVRDVIQALLSNDGGPTPLPNYLALSFQGQFGDLLLDTFTRFLEIWPGSGLSAASGRVHLGSLYSIFNSEYESSATLKSLDSDNLSTSICIEGSLAGFVHRHSHLPMTPKDRYFVIVISSIPYPPLPPVLNPHLSLPPSPIPHLSLPPPLLPVLISAAEPGRPARVNADSIEILFDLLDIDIVRILNIPQGVCAKLADLVNRHEETTQALEACGAIPLSSLQSVRFAGSLVLKTGETWTYRKLLEQHFKMPYRSFDEKTQYYSWAKAAIKKVWKDSATKQGPGICYDRMVCFFKRREDGDYSRPLKNGRTSNERSAALLTEDAIRCSKTFLDAHLEPSIL